MINIIKEIIKLSGEYKKYIKLGIWISFISGIFASIPILAVFYLFKALEKNNFQYIDVKTIYSCISIFGIAIIGGIITKYLAYHYEGYCGCYMAAKERLEIGNHLRHIPMSFFKKNSLGDIAITVTSDIKHIESNAPVLLECIVNGLVSSIISIIFLMFFNIKIGSIFALTFVIALILIGIVENMGNAEVLKQKETLSKAANSTIEYVRGIATFRMYKMMGKNTAKIKEEYNAYGNACKKSEYKLIPLVSLLFGIIKIAQSVIMIVAAVMFLNNELPLSIAAMMIVASFSFFNPLESVALASAMIRTMENTIERVKKVKNFNLIDEDGQEVTLDKYDIEIENVSFSYDENYKENDDDENTTIKDVSFKVKSNSMTAIVGPSGCGKTTITRLIARFYDAQEGSIKIGGVNVKNFTCDSLLKNISMVFQNVYLFNDTILNNIKFGNPNAAEEQVRTAAKKARCDEFIMNLPNGYNTVIGEGGASLSGGEKQRISIARAILKNAPIVLLDEATANIDPENEVYIQEAINELVNNKTLVIIAHRLNTIKDADQIVVMNDGKVDDIGKHEELIKKEGIYKRFWDIRQNANAWQVTNL